MEHEYQIGQARPAAERPPLYDPAYEHDNCGIGAIVNIKGVKTHKTVADALTIVERLEHRAGKDALGETGDGVGILLQIPHRFFVNKVKDLELPADGQLQQSGRIVFCFLQISLSHHISKHNAAGICHTEAEHASDISYDHNDRVCRYRIASQMA